VVVLLDKFKQEEENEEEEKKEEEKKKMRIKSVNQRKIKKIKKLRKYYKISNSIQSLIQKNIKI
jgi:hypothetical protein